MAHTKVTKTGTQNTGAVNTFSYSGSFDVFKATEVEVELDNVKLTYTTSTINESASPREYTVDATAKTIHVGGADLAGSNSVVLQPVTDMGAPTPRASYTPGASITSDDLNNNQLQLMRKAMEYDEQKLSSRGGTMTGNLHLGKDIDLSFEGSTDNAYETTFTVVDPTADRTLTFPNVSGNVVTTGDTATITATMMGPNSVDSSELIDGSVDNSHLADDAVDSDEIASGAIDLAHMSANSVGEHQYVDASIKGAHIANDQLDSQHYAAASIDHEHLANDSVDGDNIQDDSIDSEHYAAGSIDNEHLATDSVASPQIRDNNVTTAKILDGNVTRAKLQDDCINATKIEDDAIDSEHYVDGSIDHAHLGGDCVEADNIADNAVGTEHIADAELTTLAGMQSGTASVLADSTALAATTTEINSVCENRAGETTITDSDAKIPTSGAVVDYVAAQLAPIGGLEVIANDESFPETQPAAGVVISIADAGGLVVNGSGVSTTGDTISSDATVTINNINSQFHSSTIAAGVGMQVSSTGSGQVYNYHKALLKEADLANLSNDINDFGNRYRVNAGEPSSNNDEGDLVYDTNADKMKVYDSTTSAWKEVTSTGDFKYLFLCPAGGSGAPTLTNTTFDLREGSNSGSAASVTNAAQLLVSINGVVQKANTGTSAPAEGFALVDANTIIFGAAPGAGASVFIHQSGSAVSIPTPGDNTVSTAKIQNLAVTTGKIADQAVDLTKLPHGDGSSNGKFLRSNNGADPTWETVSTTPEGTAILSTGESGGTKFLREDGDGTSSWQTVVGAVADNCIYENDQTISNNYTIASGKGAHSVGPLTVNATVTVNGVWVIS